MKKIMRNVLALLALGASLFLVGCADALVNDGTHVRSYVNSKSGAGGAVPFHMYSGKMDFQIWADNGGGATSYNTDEETVVTQTGTWWGIAICSDSGADDNTTAAKIYDMGEVAKVTFYAKSDKATSIWLSGVADANKTSVTISDEYPEEPYEVPFTTPVTGEHYAMICIGGQEAGASWYIKDIAFFDASGNEIVPKVKK